VSSDPEKSIKKFIKRKKFRYNQISDKGAMELSRDLMDLGMLGVPVHIVLDKKGNVVFRFLGDHPEINKMLTKSIERQL
jgi:peroxiredoxin